MFVNKRFSDSYSLSSRLLYQSARCDRTACGRCFCHATHTFRRHQRSLHNDWREGGTYHQAGLGTATDQPLVNQCLINY